MSRIDVRATLTVNEENKEGVRDVVDRCVARVRESQPATLRYDWYISDDGLTCVVNETYSDSDAVLFHVQDLGPLLGEVTALGQLGLEIHGDASTELREALAPMSPTYYGELSLFER